MSDYTHEDAMRDLASFPERTRWSMGGAQDRLAAYIERLEAEVAQTQAHMNRVCDECQTDAESERIEAVKRYERAEERCLELKAESKLRDKQQNLYRRQRDKWIATARLLADWDNNDYYNSPDERIALAMKQVLCNTHNERDKDNSTQGQVCAEVSRDETLGQSAQSPTVSSRICANCANGTETEDCTTWCHSTRTAWKDDDFCSRFESR